MIDRALIIKKEWLDLILSGEKVWEMRRHKTNITGRIGLIEAGSGLIVGEVDLLGWFKQPIEYLSVCDGLHRIKDIGLLKKWPIAWVLENASRYDRPIPYKHPQGAVIWVKIKETP
jgi:hypothetical protein